MKYLNPGKFLNIYFFNYEDSPQYIVKGKMENRSDEEIIKEALTEVVVPKF